MSEEPEFNPGSFYVRPQPSPVILMTAPTISRFLTGGIRLRWTPQSSDQRAYQNLQVAPQKGRKPPAWVKLKLALPGGSGIWKLNPPQEKRLARNSRSRRPPAPGHGEAAPAWNISQRVRAGGLRVRGQAVRRPEGGTGHRLVHLGEQVETELHLKRLRKRQSPAPSSPDSFGPRMKHPVPGRQSPAQPSSPMVLTKTNAEEGTCATSPVSRAWS